MKSNSYLQFGHFDLKPNLSYDISTTNLYQIQREGWNINRDMLPEEENIASNNLCEKWVEGLNSYLKVHNERQTDKNIYKIDYDFSILFKKMQSRIDNVFL